MAVIIVGLLTTQLTIANSLIAVLATVTAIQRLVYVWKQTQKT